MDSLVSTQWLADTLGAEDLVVLDATLHLPDSPRNAPAEFDEGHIPGARFLDLASFVDAGSAVPKAVPNARQFADRMGQMGVAPGSRVVLYDDSAIRSAARAWFLFTLYGFESVAILDGGLAKWKAEGRALESGVAGSAPTAFPEPEARASVRRKADMLANSASQGEQVVDARDAARFAGEEGSGSEGHIPGARNVPFAALFAEDGTYRSPKAIAGTFAAAGVDLSVPIVTACNSGMTACVLAFALHRAGVPDAAVYDGSWLEWGSDPETPKEQGAAR
ncbi:sulfurtransferase [Qipengyuania flava]|uniref:sulfurtransferase n=1 Tax=Qipengyuania flava TaxID=192812 RepID=UPI001C628A76|nr:sulfurtransferase [Qipengyuania flava]QYJ06716.1 sulfurtransferase [Qipengyuania flava]